MFVDDAYSTGAAFEVECVEMSATDATVKTAMAATATAKNFLGLMPSIAEMDLRYKSGFVASWGRA